VSGGGGGGGGSVIVQGGGGRLKNSRKNAPIFSGLMSHRTFAVCQLTVECVGVTEKAQAQKVYQ